MGWMDWKNIVVEVVASDVSEGEAGSGKLKSLKLMGKHSGGIDTAAGVLKSKDRTG